MLSIKNLQKDVNLAPHSTYKIGGPADFFVVVKTKEELVDTIVEARKNKMHYFVLGTGANILFSDKGFRGLVIKNEFNEVSFHKNFLKAGSGAVISDLIKITAENNLSGLEHFAGIPSTVGGALWQNLHFLSPDRKSTFYIESVLDFATVLDEENKVKKVSKDFFNFGYDQSILHNGNIFVLDATFKLEPKDKTEILKQAEENLKWRGEKHPPLDRFPSCGSVFKKIDNIGAGRLIEKVGLKGYKIGGAQVSEMHANFIVNAGGAKSSDVISLIKLIQEKVKKEEGYSLETEISFVGEF